MATTEPDGRRLVLGDQTFDLALDFFLCPVHGLIVPDRFDSDWSTERGCPVPTYREEPCDEKLTAVFLNTFVDTLAKHYEEKARKEVEDRLLGEPAVEAAKDKLKLSPGDYLRNVHVRSALRAALASQEVENRG